MTWHPKIAMTNGKWVFKWARSCFLKNSLCGHLFAKLTPPTKQPHTATIFTKKKSLTVIVKMPPRKQNEGSLHDIDMEEMRRQIQLLHETVSAQQAFLEAHRRRIDDDDYGSDSSSSRSSCSQWPQLRMNDIKVDIPNFEGKLQPDEFVD